MKTITFFGDTLKVKFDTDPEPTTKRVRRGVTCTLLSGKKPVAVHKAECAKNDTFDVEIGEIVSLSKALDKLGKSHLKAAKRRALAEIRAKSSPEVIAKTDTLILSPKFDGEKPEGFEGFALK